jgi:NAD-dependent SIR2 family protein deacetylase
MTSIFCQMIGQLAEASEVAKPTPFHDLLKALDDRGKLLRVYTQNIDSLEAKTGLSFGVPEFEDRRQRVRAKTQPSSGLLTPPSSQERLPTPPADTPRCIPLHGTLQSVHCLNCNHSFALAPHLSEFNSGNLPICSDCIALEETRQLIGKRSRGIGRLRPSVVLYNETHKDGEGVGDVVQRDLLGRGGRSGPDLLLVVGTSLRVPGTKRIVREFSKAVKARGTPMAELPGNLPTPSTSPRLSPVACDSGPVRTIYLNFDFPVPSREWEGVFDVWVNGDAQTFAGLLSKEMEKEDLAKQQRAEQKKRREQEAARLAEEAKTNAKKATKSGTKRKAGTLDVHMKASKHRRVGELGGKNHKVTSKSASKAPTTSTVKKPAQSTPNTDTKSGLTIRIKPLSLRGTLIKNPTPGLKCEVIIPCRSSQLQESQESLTPSPSPLSGTISLSGLGFDVDRLSPLTDAPSSPSLDNTSGPLALLST